MNRKAIAVVVFVALLFGTYFLFQPNMKKGVKAYDVTDLARDMGLGEGTCAAKLKNTNSYPVNATYKFKGVEPQSKVLNASSRSIVEGIGCSEPSMRVVRVEKIN